jgi:hypothetical protein
MAVLKLGYEDRISCETNPLPGRNSSITEDMSICRNPKFRACSKSWSGTSIVSLPESPTWASFLPIAVKYVPKELLSDLNIHPGKKLRDERIQACYHHLIIVHLASNEERRESERPRYGKDLAKNKR